MISVNNMFKKIEYKDLVKKFEAEINNKWELINNGHKMKYYIAPAKVSDGTAINYKVRIECDGVTYTSDCEFEQSCIAELFAKKSGSMKGGHLKIVFEKNNYKEIIVQSKKGLKKIFEEY